MIIKNKNCNFAKGLLLLTRGQKQQKPSYLKDKKATIVFFFLLTFSFKFLENMKKRRIPPPLTDKPIRFIACSENSQTFNWQRTNKKAKYLDLNVTEIKK